MSQYWPQSHITQGAKKIGSSTNVLPYAKRKISSPLRSRISNGIASAFGKIHKLQRQDARCSADPKTIFQLANRHVAHEQRDRCHALQMCSIVGSIANGDVLEQSVDTIIKSCFEQTPLKCTGGIGVHSRILDCIAKTQQFIRIPKTRRFTQQTCKALHKYDDQKKNVYMNKCLHSASYSPLCPVC